MKFNLLKNYVILTLIGYFILRFMSVPVANFVLVVAILGLIPFMIFRLMFSNNFYKNSIKSVDKKFVAGNNTLANDHCTAVFTPDKTITVMENIKSLRRDKRMFTLTKEQLNINKAWYKLCRIFDFYTTIDLLKEFYDNETKVLMITLENKYSKQEAKMPERPTNKDGFVEMNKISPDSFGADFGKENKAGEGFVSMDNLKEQAQTVQRVEKEPELTGINDLMSKFGKKVDVNTAEAGELAVLPGINIVTAKKIIEYRDLNGIFKSSDDFIKAAEVKEHFVAKIKDMIEVKDPEKNKPKNGYDSDSGRIVDF